VNASKMSAVAATNAWDRWVERRFSPPLKKQMPPWPIKAGRSFARVRDAEFAKRMPTVRRRRARAALDARVAKAVQS